MHSRIMGIVTKEYYDKLHVDEGELKLPDFNYMDSLPGWADYVNPDTDFEDDFNWLCSLLDNDYFNYNTETKIIKFEKGYKEEYFKKRYEKLKEMINDADGFSKFCTGVEAHKMRQLIRDEGGFIVSDDQGYYTELDEFIRDIKPDVEYVVFDSVDYHW